MIWPLLLLVIGLAMIVVGFVCAFGGGFMSSPSRFEELMVALLLPGGAIASCAAVIWMIVLLILRWLA